MQRQFVVDKPLPPRPTPTPNHTPPPESMCAEIPMLRSLAVCSGTALGAASSCLYELVFVHGRSAPLHPPHPHITITNRHIRRPSSPSPPTHTHTTHRRRRRRRCQPPRQHIEEAPPLLPVEWGRRQQPPPGWGDAPGQLRGEGHLSCVPACLWDDAMDERDGMNVDWGVACWGGGIRSCLTTHAFGAGWLCVEA